MRAIEKPVAVFLHPRGMRFSYVLKPWVERPQYSCNLPNCVKDMSAYYKETFEKKLRRRLSYPAQANRTGNVGLKG